jgi:hypothetical protein
VYTALREIATHWWGQGETIDYYLPSRSHSASSRELLGRFERMAISPSAFLRMLRMISEIDVRAVLPAIHVPTLVIQRGGDRINPPFYGHYLADHIAGARYFEQPGDHVLRFAGGGDLDVLFAEIEDFLAAAPPPDDQARVLATILLVEAVSDTASKADAPDPCAAGQLDAHIAATKQLVRAHRDQLGQREFGVDNPVVPDEQPLDPAADQRRDRLAGDACVDVSWLGNRLDTWIRRCSGCFPGRCPIGWRVWVPDPGFGCVSPGSPRRRECGAG